MTNEEFIEKMRELDPFHSPSSLVPIDLETLYERYRTIVAEMERLEDIEDDRDIQLEKIRQYARNIVDDDTYKADWIYDVNGTKVRRDLEELLNESN